MENKSSSEQNRMVIRFKEIVTGKMVIYLLGIKRFSSVKALFKFNIIILKSVYSFYSSNAEFYDSIHDTAKYF